MYPPLPVSTDGKGDENTGIRQRLRTAKEQRKRTPLQMPLRELQQPPGQDACGHYHPPPRSLLLPAIFLYRYIKLAETHSTVLGGATAMIRPMETIVRTHRPIWGDIIQLLVSLLSPEDRHRILNEARKWFRETAPANPQRWENQPPP